MYLGVPEGSYNTHDLLMIYLCAIAITAVIIIQHHSDWRTDNYIISL